MADHELLNEVARALKPGPVEPPAARVRALRRMVKASAAISTNGEARAGDEPLVDDVSRALRVGPVEPPPDRIRALRDLVGTSAAVSPNGADDGRTEAPVPPVGARPPHDGPSSEVADLERARAQRDAGGRLSRMVSTVFAAAAVAVLVAMLVVHQLPGALRDVAHDVGLPVDSTELVTATRDIDRLELALARRDAREVAEADAAMLRSTNKLEGKELEQLQERAVRLHVEALAFLRDHPAPEAIPELASPVDPATGEALPPGQGLPPPPGSPEPGPAVPDAPPSDSTAQPPPVPTTVVPQPLRVRILSVTPRLDASFHVDFEVSGFALGPGQPYTVQFFFDSEQEVTTYTGPSPWTFPVVSAVKYHTVCAQVADASGARDPASGDCKPILHL